MRIHTLLLRIGLVSLLLVVGSSCGNDFLDPKITDVQTTDSFYQTEAQVEQALTGLYHGLRPLTLQRWFLSEVRSDNSWVQIVTNAQRDYSDIGHFRSTISNISTLSNAWNDLYLLIANANIFLEKIEGVSFYSEALKTRFIAEARFLRGLAYFELVRYFGRVPLVLTTITQEEAIRVPQSSAQEVYEQAIVPDLKHAGTNLPLDATQAGRATQMAAKALLGQVYLTMSGYPLNLSHTGDASQLLEEVIDYAFTNGKYWASTADEWRHIWTNEQDNKYHIFEVQYIYGGLGLGNGLMFEYGPGLFSAYTSRGSFGNSIWAEDTLTEAYLEGSEEDDIHDIRLVGTVDTTRFVNTDTKPPTPYTGDPFFTKFWEHKVKRAELGLTDIDALVKDNYDWPINFPLIRLEDVMLMYAEIAGPTAKGLEMVNKIRERAGVPTVSSASASEFQDIVERERRLELASEGIRWHDLVRRNVWQERIKDMYYRYALNETTGEYDQETKSYGDRVAANPGWYLYPIPESQILVKDGLYTQNTGY